MFDLASRNFYLCVGLRADMTTFLPAVLRGGVDVVQLREKTLPDDLRIEGARLMIPICRDFEVPFIMNDSPELAVEVGADGVHVGQEDTSVTRCRELMGDEAIIGLSTHSVEEFDGALSQPTSYLSAGPIVPTPTKLGRSGTGVEYAVQCQRRSERPVFVTGGVTDKNVGDLVEAGLRHFVVVRYLTESTQPELAARALRENLDIALIQR